MSAACAAATGIPAGDCDCTATNRRLGVCGGTCERLTPMPTASATTPTTAPTLTRLQLRRPGQWHLPDGSMNAVSVAAPASLPATATATATWSTPCGVCGGSCAAWTIDSGRHLRRHGQLHRSHRLQLQRRGQWQPAPALDVCGVCGGSGIPAGDCDCDGNVAKTHLGVCGGTCAADADGDGICDDVPTNVHGPQRLQLSPTRPTRPVRSSMSAAPAVAPASLPVTAIATETNSTPVACVAALVLMWMPMVFATTSTTAPTWRHAIMTPLTMRHARLWMLVASAVDLAFPPVTATAWATSSTPAASAAATAPMRMPTAFATVQTTAPM